jgi:hypothetical protein
MELFEPKDTSDVANELAHCESYATTEEDRLYVVGRWSHIEASPQETQRRGRILLQ